MTSSTKLFQYTLINIVTGNHLQARNQLTELQPLLKSMDADEIGMCNHLLAKARKSSGDNLKKFEEFIGLKNGELKRAQNFCAFSLEQIILLLDMIFPMPRN